MTSTFYLKLPSCLDAGIETQVQWLNSENDSSSVGSGSLEQAAATASGSRVIVLVPAEDVLLLKADIPTRNRQRLLKALPYALEEQLARDVKELHFASGDRGDAGETPVAVVARQRMDEWLELLLKTGIHPHQMVVETLMLPLQDHTWSLFINDEKAFIRTGPYSGYALMGVGLTEFINMALEQSGNKKPEAIHLYHSSFDDYHDSVAQLREDGGIELQEHSELSSPLEFLLKDNNMEPPINLLQGGYSRKEQLGKLWRPWRAAAAMLIISLIIQATMMIWSHNQLSRQEQLLSSTIEQIYRKTFPDARKVVNPRVQMERQLAQLRNGSSSGSFLGLLAQAGPTIKQAAGIEVESLRYKQSALEIELILADFQVLDKVKQGLIGKGLSVTITTANAQDGKVRSQLRIVGKGV